MTDSIEEQTQEELFCIGCGAKIQTTDKNQLGYTPSSVLKKGLETGQLYCQRCFKLRHYNEISDIQLSDDDFLALLNQIGDSDALIVNVVDIFDFNGSIIPGLHRFVGDNPVILVGNKVDILPTALNPNKMINWIQKEAKEQGLHPIETMLISAKKGNSVDELLALIDRERKGRDVYVVGVTNVGKSTLINRIIKQTNGMQDVITTSQFPGTTLDRIEIPLDDGHALIDTPGIIHAQQMAHYLHDKDLRLIAPQKQVKPKVYQLNAGQTLFLAGLARFDFIQGDRAGFVGYFDNELYIHRTKLENADDFYGKHLGDLLQPPHPEDLADFPELHRYEFSTKQKSDLVFAGLGWITLPADVVVAGYAPKGVSVMIRKALI
ncbi:ribosome biogenesis GTPase YqeH [Latilactobacillus fuchuensis]|uniref:Potassium-dependent GTPase involved in ribosome 30S assembly n=2 Tax=Latilactobacillus fuchuensis TaxID=164393 RepID=A0A2N9DWM7_9LACO|nr:ribosome biogenesis GTPase YqeH [Latilactobacillus fuchuensis]KRL60907.1 ribosome biogenesis GTPase YqeH [Latilactobacillus fuchuensis DSM 14340 = JCM 11249]MCP8857805.1 ribosome biogenesis GTPase YqeH [Latilactobacillus fuchuensis]SPC39090.1 potassium-dependent GTPase involved in ribosome 30S assembly [Latilactobacillus fuchuensis]